MSSFQSLTRHTPLIVGVLLIVIFGIVIGGLLVAPSLFYDQWIWRYYWGPVVADASGHSVSYHGIAATEGYTVVSELTYGIILVGALFGLYQLLKKLEIIIDWHFCLALLPYILFGPVTRVLEDASYFFVPGVYWFISPFIYLQTTVYVLLFLFLGYVLQKRASDWSPRRIFLLLLLLYVVVDVAYTIVWSLRVPYAMYRIEPGVFYVLSILAFLPFLYNFLKKQSQSINTVIFSGGLLVLLPFTYLIGRWILGMRWGSTDGVRFDVFLLVMGLTALIVALVFFIAYVNRKHDSVAAYTAPLNLSMLSGHLIDGLTSWISIYDPFHMGLPSYIEKHPASNLLLETWPPLFPIIKFLLIILVIYVFDILYKKELMRYARLVNLIKIGIFILGVSPGLRDLLRVTMGV
ncbi:MAG TPA: DUF63 family protein [Candidatus Thermoplasmatota archaeon]|nr:DUF63 family protein [Candidatus Thermoplasmatota archaeon]